MARFPERDPLPPRRAAAIQNFREAIFQYGGKGECNRCMGPLTPVS